MTPIDYDTLSHEELVRLFQEQQQALRISRIEVEQLTKQNKFLNYFYKEAPLACIYLNPEGIITRVNKIVCDIFNKKPEELEGEYVYKILPENRSVLLQNAINQLNSNNQTFNFYAHHLSDGNIVRAYLWQCIGFFDENGQLNHIIGYCYPDEIQNDIANQILYLQEKAANDALTSQRIMSCMLGMIQRNNTINIRNILELINEHYDADTCCYLAFHEEISRMCLMEIVHSDTSTISLPEGFQVRTIPEFIDRYKQGFTRIGYFGEEELLCDLFGYLVNNKIPYTASMSEPIVSGDRLWGVLIIIRQRNSLRWTDPELSLAKLFAKATAISLERLEIENDLKRHQMLESLALEKSQVYSWLYDIKSESFQHSGLLLERLGFPKEKQLTLDAVSFFDRIYPDDATNFKRCLIYSISSNEEASIQIRIHTHGNVGLCEWFEFRLIPVADKETGEPREVIGTATSIESHKQAEQHLIDMLEAKNQAEESNRLKTAFVANMSHEIRTPLNAIIGFSELLTEPDLEKEDRETYIKIIHDNNRLLLKLINDILDISRIESGQIDPSFEEVNLRNLFKEFAQLSNIRLDSKPVEIKLEDDLPDLTLMIERHAVSQIIANFIDNAIKFTKEGTITLGYKPTREGDGMTYYVRDTGCGISEEDRSRIFQRFVKINDFVQGTGLGLSICETLVKRLGGHIGVISEIGKGSEFWFTLPLHES